MIPVKPPPPEKPGDTDDTNTAAGEDDKRKPEDAEETEEGLEAGDDSCTWHDVALSIAAELMAKIRHDIHTKLGYTTSAVSRDHYVRQYHKLTLPSLFLGNC